MVSRLGKWAVLGGIASLGTSCSLLIDKDPDQCQADGDCTKFTGTSCQANVCVPAACQVLSDCAKFPGSICKDQMCVPASEGCATNEECKSQGDHYICRKDTSTCIQLTSPECSTVLGDWEDDNAVLFGAIFPLDKDHFSTGEALLDSVKLALSEFQAVNNLPPAPGKQGQRPLSVVVCSDDGSAAPGEVVAKHLVNDVGVPAIIGPAFSGVTISVATDVTIPGGTLVFSPSATSTDITKLSDHGLVWRTSPSDTYQAAAIKKYMSTVEDETKARENPVLTSVKLAILYKGDAYGRGFINALTPASGNGVLEINGDKVTSQSSAFFAKDYGNPDDEKNDPLDYKGTIDKVFELKPNIVLVIGTQEGVTQLFGPVEDDWTARAGAAPRPTWVFTDGGEVKELWERIGTDNELRQRVIGTAPGTNNQRFANFKSNFDNKFSDASPDIFGTAGSYDILYLLAYSTVALGSQPLTGANYDSALQKFFVNGDVSDVGSGITAAFSKLQAGKSINFEGASGNLTFDPKTGEAPSDIQIWCVPTDGSNATDATNSGLFYSPDDNGKLDGTFDDALCGR